MPPTVPAPQTQEQFVHLLSSREMQLYPDATPAGVVVHLMGVRNVPKPPDLKMQGLSTFVVMNVVDHCGAAVGRCVSWPPKRGTCHPVWNSGRDLSLPRRSYGELARSLLRVELWHHDPFMLGQRIGQIDVPLMLLFVRDHVELELPLSPPATSTVHGRLPGHAAESLVGLPHVSAEGLGGRLLQAARKSASAILDSFQPALIRTQRAGQCIIQLWLVGGHPGRKRLFLIRHGASVWNEAQALADLRAMYSQVDHPLSANGALQAETLAARIGDALQGRGAGEPSGTEAIRQSGRLSDESEGVVHKRAIADLCAAQVVLSSPLTRAVQTCLISLAPLLRHLHLPVYLAPNAREQLNPGGADSAGIAIGGEQVRARVTTSLNELVGAATSAEVMTTALNDLEVQCCWWSLVPESNDAVRQRVEELLCQIRYLPQERMVLVGHSHLFRSLFSAQLQPQFAEREPTLAANLCALKLSNCGVACLDLDLSAGADEPTITNVLLLLGTSLVK